MTIVEPKNRTTNNAAHRAFVERTFNVLAKTANSIFFEAYGELCCEINGYAFDCNSVDEFYELVEFWGDETFEE